MQPADPPLNEEIFDDLIAMAGPETAPQLLRQILEDLGQVSRNLESALASGDAKALHEQGHTLTSLAGTLGATEMQERAQQLSALAQTADIDAARGMSQVLMHDIARLRELVEARSATMPDRSAGGGAA